MIGQHGVKDAVQLERLTSELSMPTKVNIQVRQLN